MGEGDYGYVRRRDLPERLVPVPPQAIPPDQLPRDVAAAVRNPPDAAAAFFQIQYAKQMNDTRLIAQTNLDAGASGGGGVKVDTNETWYSRIARWCRKTTVQHNAGSFGFMEARIGVDFSLFALASVSAVRAPWVLRIEDVIAAELTVSVVGTVSGQLTFGLRSNKTTPATISPVDGPLIGFYCTFNAVGYANWHTIACGDTGTSADDHDTGITSEHPHRLTVDISGAGTITYYIDGVQVHQITGYTGTMGQTNDDGGVSWIVAAGGIGIHDCTCVAGYWMEKANISVRVLDEAA